MKLKFFFENSLSIALLDKLWDYFVYSLEKNPSGITEIELNS